MPNKGALVPGRPGLSPAPSPAPLARGSDPPDPFKRLSEGAPHRYELMKGPQDTPQTRHCPRKTRRKIWGGGFYPPSPSCRKYN